MVNSFRLTIHQFSNNSSNKKRDGEIIDGMKMFIIFLEKKNYRTCKYMRNVPGAFF